MIRRREFSLRAAAGTVGLVASSRAGGISQAEGPDPNFHVYLAFGQSNMEGFPGIEQQDKIGVDKRFQMLAAVDFAALGERRASGTTQFPRSAALRQDSAPPISSAGPWWPEHRRDHDRRR
jgi:hypothetical protein